VWKITEYTHVRDKMKSKHIVAVSYS